MNLFDYLVTCVYVGLFIHFGHAGMDAQVAYGFHHLRNEKPYLAQGPIANKVGLDNNFVPSFFTLLLHASIPVCISLILPQLQPPKYRC